jgi:hypothetical protein
MSTFHPTKRDILLVLTCFLLLGLFLQFDFSLRFAYSSRPRNTDSSSSSSSLFRGKGGDRFLDHVNAGIGSEMEGVSGGRIMAGMSEAKMSWGEEGAVRTEVLAHAPGMFSSLPYAI